MKNRQKREAYRENKIPEGLTLDDLICAIQTLDSGACKSACNNDPLWGVIGVQN